MSRIATALLAVGLFCVGVISAAVTLAPTTASAAAGINQTINYQGRLLTSAGAVVPDGTYNMEFQIWQDGNGCLPSGTCTSANAGTNNLGTLKWTEDWVYNTGGTTDTRVNVKNGYFSVSLGSVNAFGSSFNWNSDTLWLTTNIGNTSTAATFSAASGDGLMIPFKRLAANAYSLNSGQLGGLTSSQYVQLGQGIQASSSTAAAIGLNQTGSGNILDLQKGGADVQLINSSGQTLFRPTTDSATALQVQKAGTSTVVFTVDSSNSRIGIGTGAPAYAVDAVGQINASTALSVAGTTVCTSTGCTASSVSGTAAILNQTSPQSSSNFNISGVGIANTAFTTPAIRPVADSTTALQVQNAAGTTNVLTIDTSNSRVNAGTLGTPTGQLYVSGIVPNYLGQNSDANLANPTAVKIQGKYAYVLDDSASGKIDTYDISGGTPVYVGQNSDSNLNFPDAISIQGKYAYVANYSGNKMDVYDISGGIAVFVGQNSDANLNGPIDITVQGKNAYVLTFNSSKVFIYDISAGTPVYVSQNSDTNINHGHGLFVANNYAYVTSSTTGKLLVYNLATGTPVYVAQNSDSHLVGPISVYVQGKYAFVTDNSKLDTYNISSGTPVYVGQNADANLSGAYGIAVSDRYAYVSDLTNSKLLTYDISAGTPVFVGKNSDTHIDSPRLIAVSGRYAYVPSPGSTDKLNVYDLGGAYIQQLEAGSLEVGNLNVDSEAVFAQDLSAQGGLNIGQGAEINGTLGVGGAVTLQNSANSNAALQVQNASGLNALAVNTSTNNVTIGGLAAPGTLGFATAATGGTLAQNTTYYYKVTALDSTGGESAPSPEGSKLTGNTTATNTITVSWSTVPGATSYRVYRGIAGGLESTYYTTASTSFIDTNAAGTTQTPPIASTAGAVHISAAGESIQNATNSTSEFSVQTASGSSVLNADSTNARVGVDVTYAAMSAPSGLASSPAFGGSLTAGAYKYEVTAIDAANGETTVSNEVTGTTAGSNLTNSLTWTAVSGAYGYRIYRTASGGSTGTEGYVSSSQTNSFKDTGAFAMNSTITPPAAISAYVPTNTSNNELQLSVGGNGSPTGQLYVSGVVPKYYAQSNASPAGGLPVNLASYGQYLYGITSTKLYVYNTSSGSPTFIGMNSDSNITSSQTLTISGHYAYVAGPAKLDVYDLSGIIPVYVGQNTDTVLGATVQGAASVGHYVYVTSYSTNKIVTYDISNPAVPVVVGVNSDSALLNPENIAISGKYAYVANASGSGHLVVYDISGGLPVYVGQNTDSNANNSWNVVINGRYALVLGSTTNKLNEYDITNPTVPVFIGQNSDSNINTPFGLTVSGQYAYVTNQGSYKIDAYNIASGTPVYVGQNSDNYIGNPLGALAIGRYLYVAGYGSAKVFSYDIGGAYTSQLQAGTAELGYLTVDNDTNLGGALNTSGSAAIGQTLTVGNGAVINGTVQLQSIVNSAAALQVSNTSSVNALEVNTSNNTVTIGGLAAPSGMGSSTSTSGGTLAANTYYYKVTALDAFGGESLPSAEKSQATTGSTSTVTVTWTAVAGATTYRIYRGTTSGGESVYYTSATNSYTDTNAGSTAGTPPTASTAGAFHASATALTFQNTSNSTGAFQVQSASGVGILDVDTTNGRVGINTTTPSADLSFGEGASRQINVVTRTTNTGGNSLTLAGGNAGSGAAGQAGGDLVVRGGNAAGTTGSANGGNIYLFGGAGINGGPAGGVIIQPAANTTGALLVENASSVALISADTSANVVTLGTAGSLTGQLALANATGSNTVKLQSGASTAAYTLTLPTSAPSTNQCLQSGPSVPNSLVFGSCASGGGGPYSPTIVRASGFPTNTNVAGATTLSINPQHIGDLIIFTAIVNNTSIGINSITGGHATGWTQIKTVSYNGYNSEMWTATATATGAQNISVNWSSPTTGITQEMVADSFTTGLGSNSVWSVDNAATQTNSASTTVTMPSLTPVTTGEAYWGYGLDSAYSSGSTSGFTYTSLPTSSNAVMVNTSLTAGTPYQPTYTQSSSAVSWGLAMTIRASSSGASFINNSALTTQSANFNIQAATAGSTAATVQANASGTGDVLDLLTGTGNVAVAVDSTGALSVSGGNNPTAVGIVSLATTPTSGDSIAAVSGHYTYLIDGANAYLEIYDTSNPASPVNVSSTHSYNIGTELHGIVVQGNYLYTDTRGSFDIWDVSDPTQPIDFGTTVTGWSPSVCVAAPGIAVKGNYAYIVDSPSCSSTSSRLSVFDVTNPQHPTLISATTLNFGADDITIAGNYMYIGAEDSAVHVVNITQPSAPYVIGTTGNIGATRIDGVTANGRYVYAYTYIGTLVSIDVSVPSAPVEVDSIAVSGGSQPMFVSGNWLYMDNNGGIIAVNIADPTNMYVTSTVTGTLGHLVGISGRYAIDSDLGFGSSQLGTYDLGGAYLQVLQAGTTTTSTLKVDGDATIGGGLNVQGGIGASNVDAQSIATGTLNISQSVPHEPAVAFGQDTNAYGGSSNDAGIKMANQFTNGSSAQTVNYLNVWVGDIDPTQPYYEMAIYSDSSNTPGTLIVASGAAKLTPDAWNSIPIATTTLSASTKYWLAIEVQSDNTGIIEGAPAAFTAYNAAQFGTMASSFGSSLGSGDSLNMFASLGSVSSNPPLFDVQGSGGLDLINANAVLNSVGIGQMYSPSGVGDYITPNTPTVTVHGTAASTTYDYEVAPIDDYGNVGETSSIKQITTGQATLSGTLYNIVSWTSTGAPAYNIYRVKSSSTTAADAALGLVGTVSGTTFNDTGSAPVAPVRDWPFAPTITTSGTAGSTSYSYEVAPVYANGEIGGASPVGTIATGNATLDDTNYTNINWGVPAGGAVVTWNIYRTSSSANFQAGLIGTTTNSSWTDQGTALVSPGFVAVGNSLTASTHYYYAVTAVDAAGGETTPSYYDDTTNATGRAINLAWLPDPGAHSYNIYRTTTSASYSLIATTTATAYEDNGAPVISLSTQPPAINTAFLTQLAGNNSTNSTNAVNQLTVGSAAGVPAGQLFVTGEISTRPVGALIDPTYGSVTNGGTVVGNYEYSISSNDSTFTIIDNSSPTSPRLVSQTHLAISPNTVQVAGRYAYLTGASYFGEYLDVVDISNPSAPVEVGDVAATGQMTPTYSSTLAGNYLYLTGPVVGTSSTVGNLQVVDISNPLDPVVVSNTNLGESSVSGFAMQGHYGYVTFNASSGYAFAIYDLSSPTQPVLVSTMPVGSLSGTTISGLYQSDSVGVQGRYAYVTNYDFGSGDNTGSVIDIANPASPSIVGSFATDNNPYVEYISGHNLYVVNLYKNTITVNDITNPALPTYSRTVNVDPAFNMFGVVGRYVYGVTSSYPKTTYETYDMGGTYTQQLQAGDTQTSSLQVDDNANVGGNVNIQGSTNIAGSLNVGAIGASGLTIAGTTGAPTSVIGATTLSNGGVNVGSSNNLNEVQFTTGSTGSTVTYLNVYVGAADNAPNNQYQMALYSDLSNAPNTLLATSAVGTLLNPGWNSIAIPATTLSASTKYWIAYNSNSPNQYLDDPYISTGNLSSLAEPAPNTPTAGTGTGSLTNGTTYYYRMTAIDSSGKETSGSPEVSFTATATKKIINTWPAVPGAIGYRLYRGTASGGQTGYIAIADGTTITYTDDGTVGLTAALVPPVTYYVGRTFSLGMPATFPGGVADGINTLAVSASAAPSNQSSAAFQVLSGISTNVISVNAVNQTVLIGGVPAPNNVNGANGASGGSLATSTEYYYVVTALDSQGGETLPSFETNATTTGTNRQNTITWTASPGAVGYRVYRGTQAGLENVYYSVGNVLTYNDNGSASSVGAPPTVGSTGAIHASSAGISIQNGSNSANEFLVQNASGTTIFSVDSTNSRVVVGSTTTDVTQINLQLDSYSTLAESGSGTGACTTTANQGALYYNTNSNAIRACTSNGTTAAWEDVVNNSDLALLMYGVVPNSGPTPGDLVGVSGNNNSPCKVYWASATTYSVAPCVAYSGGRKVNVVAVTGASITGIGTATIYENICLNSSGVPTLSGGANATDGLQTSGNMPTSNAVTLGQPLLCLATLKGNGTANTLAAIYDIRTFTTSTKTYGVLNSTTQILGGLVQQSTTQGLVSTVINPTATNIIGVVVAGTGSASSTTPNIIIVTAGPQWIKATGTSAIAASTTTNSGVIPSSTTNGYTSTGAEIATFNSNVGTAQVTIATSCSTNTFGASTSCQFSQFTIISIH